MPNLVTDLIVDRVDLVEEGANSAAFIELYKRKEPMTMTYDEVLNELKPEHAEIIKSKVAEGDQATADLKKATEDLEKATLDLTAANEALQKAQEKIPCECDGEADENGVCKVCGMKKPVAKNTAFDEAEVMKSMPEEARKFVETLKSQKIAAEAVLKQAREEKEQAEAVAKAATLKSLPVEQSKLVGILKGASAEVIEVLTLANAAVETAVLGEVGKSASNATAGGDANKAWSKIETEAANLMKSNAKLTKEQAIADVVKTKPELYKEYVDGGAE